MARPPTKGMTVTEGVGADSAIARPPTAVTAFIGRALRGPVNQPVRVRSLAEYQQVFGGLWQPSTLSYAIDQFFDSGGVEAVVVRVINGGASATIALPCDNETLLLEALSPGSREVLRASVDYDNVAPGEEDRFNLVVQRVRAVDSERIEDQEIFRRVSIQPGSSRHVAAALQDSMLVRVRGQTPSVRPDRTFRPGSRHPIGYVYANPDGDDGAPLTDYDLIGSAQRRSGLFALSGVDDLHFLCIPPPLRDRDVGPGVLLAAAQFCRENRLLLIVDPPAAWHTCDDALRGLRELAFRSEHALLCFPRVIGYDRLRGKYETFANGAAVAGAIARMDEHSPPWIDGGDEELLLRPGLRPARLLSDSERSRLRAHGINTLQSLRSGDRRRSPLRTLAPGSDCGPHGALLTPRRRQLLCVNAIERGTRWARFRGSDRNTWGLLARQVRNFLQGLAGGIGMTDGDAFYVVCDERLHSAADLAAGSVHVLFGLRGQRPGEFQSCMISQRPQGSRVRFIRSNVLAPGTRMTVAEPVADTSIEVEVAADTDAIAPRPTLAQQLFVAQKAERGQLDVLRSDSTAP